MSKPPSDRDNLVDVSEQLDNLTISPRNSQLTRTTSGDGRDRRNPPSNASVLRSAPRSVPRSVPSVSLRPAGVYQEHEGANRGSYQISSSHTTRSKVLTTSNSSQDEVGTQISMVMNTSGRAYGLSSMLQGPPKRKSYGSTRPDLKTEIRIVRHSAELAGEISQFLLRTCHGDQQHQKSSSYSSTSHSPGTTRDNGTIPHTQLRPKRGRPNKNNLDEAEDDSEESGNDDHSGQRKRAKQSTLKLFACPYAKYNPGRYSTLNVYERRYRKCGTIYAPTLRSLKQHIKRVHTKPEWYCANCYQEFSSSELFHNHQTQRPPCEPKKEKFQERVSKVQAQKLRMSTRGVSEHDLWMYMYKVLFPNATSKVTPYVLDDPLEHFLAAFKFFDAEELFNMMRRREDFLGEEAPEVVYRALQLTLRNGKQILEDHRMTRRNQYDADSIRPATPYSIGSPPSFGVSSSPMSLLSATDSSQTGHETQVRADLGQVLTRDDCGEFPLAAEGLQTQFKANSIVTDAGLEPFDSAVEHGSGWIAPPPLPWPYHETAGSMPNAKDGLVCESAEYERILEEFTNSAYFDNNISFWQPDAVPHHMQLMSSDDFRGIPSTFRSGQSGQ